MCIRDSYMIPAQYHCLDGGDPVLAGANLLTPLIDWVQHGTAPEALSFHLAATKTPEHGTTDGGSLSVAPLDPLASLPSGSKMCIRDRSASRFIPMSSWKPHSKVTPTRLWRFATAVDRPLSPSARVPLRPGRR